jgi:hypothetical protein
MSFAARVTCLTTNGNIALSGCSEGSLHLWRMADGQLADIAAAEHAGAAVTAVECLGPLMVSLRLFSLCSTADIDAERCRAEVSVWCLVCRA